MTDYSSMTKADLLKEVGRLEWKLDNAQPIAKAQPPEVVPEAVALASCIRAIDQAIEQTSNRTRNGYRDVFPTPPSHEVSRILTLLASKYGVQLIEVRHEPCAKTHVEQIDPSAVAFAVQNALGIGATHDIRF